MEDNRSDFIVIVAGYTEQMNGFIDSNPGLKSRFTRYMFLRIILKMNYLRFFLRCAETTSIFLIMRLRLK